MAVNKSNATEDFDLIIQIAEKTVLQLARDWQQNPCHWYQELDIHAELRGRLNTVFSLIGLAECYTDNSANPPIRYGRVQCAPNITIANKGLSVKPDIVVWDEAPDPEHWDKWSAIWACEIKYDSIPNDEDVHKLRELLKIEKIRHGCSLIFENAEINSLDLTPDMVYQDLKICRVTASRKGCSD